jgi:hypothetical protein
MAQQAAAAAAAAVPIGMNQGQLSAIIAACNARPPGKKVGSFNSGNGVEWGKWRSNFTMICTINGWDDQRARREIFSSMTGDVKAYVEHIPAGDDIVAPALVAPPHEQLLDAYEAMFMTAAAGDAARVAMRDARQAETETVLQWHSRLRHLWRRSHPGATEVQMQANRDLMDMFILGLAHATVRTKTWDARPATYALCLEQASNSAASITILNAYPAGPAPAVKIEPGLFGIAAGTSGMDSARTGRFQQPRPSGQEDRKCHFCTKPGHLVRDCILLTKARGFLHLQNQNGNTSYPTRGRARGRGRGGRGTGRGRGSDSRGRGGRSMFNSMEEGGEDTPALAAITMEGSEEPDWSEAYPTGQEESSGNY